MRISLRKLMLLVVWFPLISAAIVPLAQASDIRELEFRSLNGDKRVYLAHWFHVYPEIADKVRKRVAAEQRVKDHRVRNAKSQAEVDRIEAAWSKKLAALNARMQQKFPSTKITFYGVAKSSETKEALSNLRKNLHPLGKSVHVYVYNDRIFTTNSRPALYDTYKTDDSPKSTPQSEFDIEEYTREQYRKQGFFPGLP